MKTTRSPGRKAALIVAVVGLTAVRALATQAPSSGQAPAPVTFAKDIAPILQRSCQNCHRPQGVGPMPLTTYEEVRPWARTIKARTSIGPRAGVMPPWYIEKDVGIQQYKNDPSLSDDEILTIAKWADTGAPQGNPADMPPPRQFADANKWLIGEPDLIVKSPEVTVKATAPDWWGLLPSVPTGLTEDRYIADVQVREVNDIPRDTAGGTVGGRYIFHHMNYAAQVPGADLDEESPGTGPSATSIPTHEVGRNVDVFDPEAGLLLAAGSHLVFRTAHLHSPGRDAKAHLEFGFKLHPKGYKPTKKFLRGGLGNGANIDIRPNTANQTFHAYSVLDQHTKIFAFEPHLHAPGSRMCLEAIWGSMIQTLTCAGYDHNWVRIYSYADDAAPLLPKGTILHLIGTVDTSPANKNVSDTRNWQGAGQRSVSNMFLDLGLKIELTEEQFQEEMAKRREKLKLTRNDVLIGCPLCNVPPPPRATAANR
jgi:hypothetical protein